MKRVCKPPTPALDEARDDAVRPSYGDHNVAFVDLILGKFVSVSSFEGFNLPSLDSLTPALDVAADGSGAAAWAVVPSGPWRVQASLYAPTAGWTSPTPLGTGAALYAYDPDVAVGDGGLAAFAWHEDGPTAAHATIYDPATGWGADTLLQNGSGPAGFPRVASAGPGAFAFFWREEIAVNWTSLVRFWSALAGWSEDFPLGAPGEFAEAGDIAGDASGRVTAAWASLDITGRSVFARTLDPASGWGSTVPIGTSPDPIRDLRASRSQHGATVAWRLEPRFPPFIIRAAVETGDGYWFTDMTVVEDIAQTTALHVASAADGASFVGAVHFNGSAGEPTVWTFDRETERSRLVSLAGGLDGDAPALASSSSGHVTAVWIQDPFGDPEVRAAVYTADDGRGPSATLDPLTNSTAYAATASADAKGNALVAWVAGDGNLYSTRITEVVAPAVSIRAPLNATTVAALTALLVVDAEPGTALSSAYFNASTPESGTVTVLVNLTEGLNVISVEAQDAAGNRAGDAIVVYATDPTANLTKDLEETLSQLNSTQQRLNETQDQFDTMESNMTMLIRDLGGALDEIQSLEQQLSESQANQSQSTADLVALSQHLSVEQGKLELLKGVVDQQSDTISRSGSELARLGGQATALGLGGLVAGAAALALALITNWKRRKPGAKEESE